MLLKSKEIQTEGIKVALELALNFLLKRNPKKKRISFIFLSHLIIITENLLLATIIMSNKKKSLKQRGIS